MGSQVSANALWRYGHPAQSIKSTLFYDSDEPYSIKIAFEDSTVWTISRDLLYDGLTQEIGDGDVRCFTRSGFFIMMLRTPESQITLGIAANTIEFFLDQTYDLVSSGNEMVDIDSLVERLLND